jgi:hypothetical protein
MERTRILRLLAMLSTAALIAACSSPYVPPVFESRPPGQTKFSGISQLVLAAPTRVLDVLLVHGMCTHGKDWAEGAINELNATLSGTTSPKIEPVAVDGTRVVLYQSTLSIPSGTVRTAAMVWSPIIAPLKNQLCYDQTDKSDSCKDARLDEPRYPYKRASINRALKDTLMDDCLADAIIYQGKSRDAISEQIQKAVLTAASVLSQGKGAVDIQKAAAAASTPLVLVTESLGSKIAFDAIYRLVKSENPGIRSAGLQTLNRTAQIFMGANQMPLLALGDQSLDGVASFRINSSAFPPDPLAALLELKLEGLGAVASTSPKVVAFTDPNDLLSYILVPARQTATYDVVDVIVSNEKTYAGALERPDTAHTGYLKNRDVTRLIACGNLENGTCKPQ